MASPPRLPARREVAFKAALFLLLAVNTAYYALYGTASKGIDAAAWLVLLVLLQAETSFGARLTSARTQIVLRALRLAAAAGVIASTAGYVFEDNALDAINSALWILVVLMLEAEIRFARVAARHHRFFHAAATLLYGGLGLLVAVWAVRGMWMDAYDAALWLTAFITLELDIESRPRGAET